MYSIADAAAYLCVPRSTLATWMRGERGGGLSFGDLAEVYVLASVARWFRMPQQRLRRAPGGHTEIRWLVESALERVDLDDSDLPARLYPWRRDLTEPKVISLDPKRAFGRPTVAGSAVQTETIIDRFRGGDSIEQLASDYQLAVDVVEEVLRWGIDVSKQASRLLR